MSKPTAAKKLRFWLVTAAQLVATVALAVDVKPIDVTARWQVVGVISGAEKQGKAFGIAVLKNVESKRTYTISVGDSLPADGGFSLAAIRGKSVTVTDGSATFELEFAPSEVKETDSPPPATARFLDSYYRGLGTVAGDGRETAEAPAADDGVEYRSYVHTAPRFGTYRGPSLQPRFELYRPGPQGRREPLADGALSVKGESGDETDESADYGDDEFYENDEDAKSNSIYGNYAEDAAYDEDADADYGDEPAVESTQLEQYALALIQIDSV
jgi:hypothetical protein